MNIFRYLVAVLVCISWLGCDNNEQRQIIPYARVEFKIDVKRNKEDMALKDAGTAKEYTNARLGGEYIGYAGLLVVSSAEYNNSGFPILFAYDLCCPHEANRNIKVKALSSGLRARCDKCGSEYDIISGLGTPVDGPAKDNLQKYSAYPQGADGVYRIVN